jgi:hypothetical protein
MVALCIAGILAGVAFLSSGLIPSGSDVAGAVIGLIGLFSKCFADAFQFEFGTSRGSLDKSASQERLTASLVSESQRAAPTPVAIAKTGPVTTDSLNDASLAAARGQR